MGFRASMGPACERRHPLGRLKVWTLQKFQNGEKDWNSRREKWHRSNVKLSQSLASLDVTGAELRPPWNSPCVRVIISVILMGLRMRLIFPPSCWETTNVRFSHGGASRRARNNIHSSFPWGYEILYSAFRVKKKKPLWTQFAKYIRHMHIHTYIYMYIYMCINRQNIFIQTCIVE